MILCDEGHQEVCFEGRVCPVCEKGKEIIHLEGKIEDLETEIDGLKAEIRSWEESENA